MSCLSQTAPDDKLGSMTVKFTAEDLEFFKDSRTLWINGPDGLIARFGALGIDIHLDGSCSGGFCTHSLTTNQDWELFKEKMLEIYQLVVTDEHKPDRLILDNS
jgi:hypothetical protein